MRVLRSCTPFGGSMPSVCSPLSPWSRCRMRSGCAPLRASRNRMGPASATLVPGSDARDRDTPKATPRMRVRVPGTQSFQPFQAPCRPASASGCLGPPVIPQGSWRASMGPGHRPGQHASSGWLPGWGPATISDGRNAIDTEKPVFRYRYENGFEKGESDWLVWLGLRKVG